MLIYEHTMTKIDVRLHFNYLLKHLKFAEYAGLLQRGYLYLLLFILYLLFYAPKKNRFLDNKKTTANGISAYRPSE